MTTCGNRTINRPLRWSLRIIQKLACIILPKPVYKHSSGPMLHRGEDLLPLSSLTSEFLFAAARSTGATLACVLLLHLASRAQAPRVLSRRAVAGSLCGFVVQTRGTQTPDYPRNVSSGRPVPRKPNRSLFNPYAN